MSFEIRVLAQYRAGKSKAEIARLFRCHEQTVYYWTNPKRREVMKEKTRRRWRNRGERQCQNTATSIG